MGEMQNGFRPARRGEDNLFILTSVVELSRRRSKGLICCTTTSPFFSCCIEVSGENDELPSDSRVRERAIVSALRVPFLCQEPPSNWRFFLSGTCQRKALQKSRSKAANGERRKDLICDQEFIRDRAFFHAVVESISQRQDSGKSLDSSARASASRYWSKETPLSNFERLNLSFVKWSPYR